MRILPLTLLLATHTATSSVSASIAGQLQVTFTAAAAAEEQAVQEESPIYHQTPHQQPVPNYVPDSTPQQQQEQQERETKELQQESSTKLTRKRILNRDEGKKDQNDANTGPASDKDSRKATPGTTKQHHGKHENKKHDDGGAHKHKHDNDTQATTKTYIDTIEGIDRPVDGYMHSRVGSAGPPGGATTKIAENVYVSKAHGNSIPDRFETTQPPDNAYITKSETRQVNNDIEGNDDNSSSKCQFCPDGLPDRNVTIPTNDGATCGQAQDVASTLDVEDVTCTTLQLAQNICCPPDAAAVTTVVATSAVATDVATAAATTAAAVTTATSATTVATATTTSEDDEDEYLGLAPEGSLSMPPSSTPATASPPHEVVAKASKATLPSAKSLKAKSAKAKMHKPDHMAKVHKPDHMAKVHKAGDFPLKKTSSNDSKGAKEPSSATTKGTSKGDSTSSTPTGSKGEPKSSTPPAKGSATGAASSKGGKMFKGEEDTLSMPTSKKGDSHAKSDKEHISTSKTSKAKQAHKMEVGDAKAHKISGNDNTKMSKAAKKTKEGAL